MKFAQWAKMYMALAGGIGTGALGLSDLPATWKLPLELVVVAATAFATWRVPNAPEAPSGPGEGYTHEGPGELF